MMLSCIAFNSSDAKYCFNQSIHNTIIKKIHYHNSISSACSGKSHKSLFESLFFDGTVITGKFCVGVPLNIQSIYLSHKSFK